MKKNMFFKVGAFWVFFSFICSIAFSQSLVSYPYNILKPLPGYTVDVNLFLIDADLPGTGNYTWSVSPSNGVIGLASSTIDASQTVSFTSDASGSYTFTISRGDTSVTAIITVCNLMASIDGTFYGVGQVLGGFVVDNGELSPDSPDGYVFFDNGLNDTRAAAAAVNKEGYFYYIPTVKNAGEMQIIAATPNGTLLNSIASFDVNGPEDPTQIDFVRLGIDADGTGWILAADTTYTKIYLAKFITNGLTNTTPVVVSSKVLFSGEGSAQDFRNGDLAIDGMGIMIVLANNGEGNTVIFSLDTKAATPVLTKRFLLNDNNNVPFDTQVNGVAFDSTGNVYFSSYQGLFFIDKNSVNNASGTVVGSLVVSITGMIDLASKYWPVSSVVPLKLGDFSVVQHGNSSILKWNTFSEQDLKYFEIEKSYTGNDFYKIGLKAAIGTSANLNYYDFSDELDLSFPYVYYRLKAIDKNGHYSYSKIIKIKLNKPAMQMVAYPNPFANELSLKIHSNKKEKVSLAIYNTNGQIILNKKLNLNEDLNTIALTAEMQYLKKGTYVIKIISQDGSIFEQKITKN